MIVTKFKPSYCHETDQTHIFCWIAPQPANVFLNRTYLQFSPLSNRLTEIVGGFPPLVCEVMENVDVRG